MFVEYRHEVRHPGKGQVVAILFVQTLVDVVAYLLVFLFLWFVFGTMLTGEAINFISFWALKFLFFLLPLELFFFVDGSVAEKEYAGITFSCTVLSPQPTSLLNLISCRPKPNNFFFHVLVAFLPHITIGKTKQETKG